VLQVDLNESDDTITRSASSCSSPFPYYFFPSGLAPLRENVASPTPLKGLHYNFSNTVTGCINAEHKADPVGLSLRL
jgi:hypothetical protein